jgi:hypothetical protein
MRTLVSLCLLLAAATAAADPVYKWIDERGVVHYGDRPLGAGAKAVKLPGLTTGGPSAKKSSGKKFSGPLPFGGAGPQIQVTQPSPDSTLSHPEGQFTVAVSVLPSLATGYSLSYYLDGEVQNPKPTASTAFLYTGAEKGDHMISVGVLDSSGHEVSRSEPVIVHLEPAPKQIAEVAKQP